MAKNRPATAPWVLTGYLFLLMFAYGVSVTMFGPLMPGIISRYGVSLAVGGSLFSFYSVGGLVSILTGALLADRFDKSWLVLASFSVYSIAMLLLGLGPGFIVLILLFFLLGSANRLLDTVLNAYVADLYPRNRGFYLSLLHAFFGGGAFVGPLYARLLLDRNAGWNRIFLILGAIFAGMALLYLVIRRVSPPQGGRAARKPRLRDYRLLLTDPRVWVVCLVMVVYTGHQAGLTVWLPMYMQNGLSLDATLSSLALSIFWVGIILGRFIASGLSVRIEAQILIQWGGLAGGVVLLGGILSARSDMLIAGVGLAGMATGAVVPLLIMMSCNWYPDSSGTATSLLYLGGTLGRLVFPLGIGLVAEYAGFQIGMLATALPLLAIFVLILPLWIRRGVD